MLNCKNLLHPFQNDPGTSQRQRIIDQLLADSVKIDGRSLADLLNYFYKLAAGINYYDKDLNVGDWQPFFHKSLPFLLASLSKYDGKTTLEKFELYKTLFKKRPTIAGLQLMIYFIHYNIFTTIYKWHEEIRGSKLSIETSLDELIRDKLAALLKRFIGLANAASKWFCVKKIDFTKFLDTAENDVWSLDIAELYAINDEFPKNKVGKCEKMAALYELISGLLPTLLETLKLLALLAEANLKQSLIPDEKELQENHPPHLALIFAFISLFQKMQGELNKKTKEHLQFFYTEVLKIKPADAKPDSAHVVFEIQKLLEGQYEKYRVQKATLLNAGRDEKNKDVFFATDDEIIVNETQIAELKTLFLNNQQAYDKTYIEGVYIAPFANKADGVDKDFKEDPKNCYTLGNNKSKYIKPGEKIPKAYPPARLGFALASPVLFLNEGKRTVTITLACQLESTCIGPDYPDFVDAKTLYKTVRLIIDKGFYLITEDLIQQAAANGVAQNILDNIRKFLPDVQSPHCYPQPAIKQPSVIITEARWRTEFFNGLADPNLKLAISEIFKVRKIFKIQFSGAEDWIEPTRVKMKIDPLNMGVNNQFTLKIKAQLGADKPAVTFFDKVSLKEELGSTLPLVKIQLDEELKILKGFTVGPKKCCLQKTISNKKRDVSFYHFFRNVKLLKTANGQDTRIDVKVCGLKNFVVQNDENLMDVNAPIYPFGTRPDVADFDMVNPIKNPPQNVIGPSFYIGSKEIFCKKWNKVQLNLNWKDKPISFNDYYKGYIARTIAGNTVFGLNETDFEYRLSYLSNGEWINEPVNRKLFEILIVPPNPLPPLICNHKLFYDYAILINYSAALLPDQKFLIDNTSFQKLETITRNGFIKLNLRNQDFGHKNYAFVLARQMMAYSKLPKETIATAVYYDANGDPIVIDFDTIYNEIKIASDTSVIAENDTLTLDGIIDPDAPGWNWTPNFNTLLTVRDIVRGPNLPLFPTGFAGLKNLIGTIKTKLGSVKGKIDSNELKKFAAVIPNEPWTPTISNISLDYTATAKIEDIDLIHLYPYSNTYKSVEISLQPTLFPLFCDEGNLFIGLKDFQPGSNLNILFQLAEATADSETGEEKVLWHFLDNNIWKELRTGFEVLKDNTFNLTTSGIVKFSLPENMTNDNTIMPKNLCWIKASVPKNSKSVSETIAIYTQAVRATFKMEPANDKARLAIPLEAGSIAKLLVADPAIKSVTQPYESFGGKLPELESTYYLRVSELLRHNGRAIQKWDYERLVLEEYPEIYKAKCINHSFQTDAHIYENDVPYAPGYVLLAIIPDLRKLKAGNSFEPRAPVSLLEKINKFLTKKTSPFVRFKSVNPRYEQVHFCITARFILGADENFYKEKLKSDLREFLAPWAVGKYDKLSFGQCVYRSDVLRFLERTEYIDFIRDIQMKHETKLGPMTDIQKVCPLSPRSVLIAGTIDIRIDQPVCDSWCNPRREFVGCDEIELVNDYCNKNDLIDRIG
jgi:hypothetical protein